MAWIKSSCYYYSAPLRPGTPALKDQALPRPPSKRLWTEGWASLGSASPLDKAPYSGCPWVPPTPSTAPSVIPRWSQLPRSSHSLDITALGPGLLGLQRWLPHRCALASRSWQDTAAMTDLGWGGATRRLRRGMAAWGGFRESWAGWGFPKPLLVSSRGLGD